MTSRFDTGVGAKGDSSPPWPVAPDGTRPNPGQTAIDRPSNLPAEGTELRLMVDPTMAAPGEARRALAQWQMTLHRDSELTDDTLVVVSELVTNAVRHARSPSEIIATMDDDVLRLEVHDLGPDPPVLRARDSGVGGYGLRFVAGLTDRWGWRPTATGKYVWTETDCGPPRPWPVDFMTGGRLPDHLQLGLELTDRETIVNVGGEVISTTAPTLEVVVTALLQQGHRDLVLDLGDVQFMDGAGAEVIQAISACIALAGGHLTVQRATAPTQRILDVAGAGTPVRSAAVDETATTPIDPCGDVCAAPPPVSAVRARRITYAGSASSSHDIVDSALRSLTLLAGASIPGADGASVTLERNGRLATVASTNGTILRMDAHQYNTGQGPCLAAGAHGRPFYVESLAEEHRWPAFVPRAIAEGIACILSTPVTIAKQTVGALNFYSSTERAFGPGQHELADVFAAEAASILTAGAELVDEKLADRVAQALRSREVIAIARGVLMAQSRISADEAAAALIRSARAMEITVLEEATEVVASASAVAMPGHESRHGG